MSTPPANPEEFLDLLRRSELLAADQVAALSAKIPPAIRRPHEVADFLIHLGAITSFHAGNLLKGRHKGFIVGRFRVLEQIGSGGMATVYLCEHRMLGHRVAMKVLPTKATSDPVSVERFFREARAAASLNHPNLVRAYDIDKQENFFYLIMDYVEGISLQDLVTRRGALDPLRAAHYVAQAAQGLQHVHSAGLVHRDIKPGNLLLDRNGTIRVMDLGLARYTDNRGGNLTRKYGEKMVLGTVDYISPEQAIASYAVDFRTDIYSLGATFYFLLTGQSPFEGATNIQKLLYHQTHEPQPLRTMRSDIPPAMAMIVEKMMDKNPAERHQTPLEVAEALKLWTTTPIPPLASEGISLPPGANPLSHSNATSLDFPTPIEPLSRQKHLRDRSLSANLPGDPEKGRTSWLPVGGLVLLLILAVVVWSVKRTPDREANRADSPEIHDPAQASP